MPYAGFLPNTTLPPSTLIPAPPREQQPELLNYSNSPQLSTQPINFANTDKTSSSEFPQPIHTVSTIDDTTHDFSLLSDTSNLDSIRSQFSSPTASQIANNPFNPPQRPITNIQRLLSQAHWSHSFIIVNSLPSFQSSLPLSFPGTPPIITLSSNSPTPDPDQHSQDCIGKQPDTTRNSPTLSLKLDPKIIVLPLVRFGDHDNVEQFYNWAKQRIYKSYKMTPERKQSSRIIKTIKDHFLC